MIKTTTKNKRLHHRKRIVVQKYNSFGHGKVNGNRKAISQWGGGSTHRIKRKSILAYYFFLKLTTRATTTRTYSRGFTLAFWVEKNGGKKVTTSQSGKIYQSTLVRQQRMVHDTIQVHGRMKKTEIGDGPFASIGPKTLTSEDSTFFC